jgi:hypothetical protein
MSTLASLHTIIILQIKILFTFILIMKLVSFASLIFILSIFHSDGKILKVKDGESQLSKSVRALIDKLIEMNHVVFDFIQIVDNEMDSELLDLQTEIYRKAPRTIILRLDHFEHLKMPILRLRRIVFLYLESVEIFLKFRDGFVTNRFDFHGYFIFILYKGYTSDVQVIFDEMWKKNIYNVYAVYENDHDIDLSTFRPFARKCGEATASPFNKFVNGTFVSQPIFYKKLINFNQCPLRVTTFEDPGCIMVRNATDGKQELYGHCIDHMNAMAQALNFKPVVDFITDLNSWGQIYTNGSAKGLNRKLLYGETDIAFGDLYLKEGRTKYFDATKGHTVAQMVFIIPQGQQLTAMEKLLQPFSMVVWILLLFTVTIGLVVIFVINHKLNQHKTFVFGTKVNSPVMNMLMAIFGMQQPVLPNRNFARFILTMFIILCLVMRSIYQGSLYLFLQSDGRHKEVQSISQLIDENYTIFIYLPAIDLVNASYPQLMPRVQFYKVTDSFLRREIDESQKVAGLENLRNIVRLNRRDQSKQRSSLKYCKQTFMNVNNVWYLPRNSYLTNTLNKKTELFLAGGFIQHWTNRYVDPVFKNNERKLQQLNLRQMAGTFHILLIGYFVALVAFVCEKLAVTAIKFKLQKYGMRYLP